MRLPILSIVISLCCGLAGCQRPVSNAPASHMPTVAMTIGSKTYTLEIASKDADRQQGMMYRDALAPDRGMIFAFTQPSDQGFWMKNVRIPLDIIFLDETGKIVSIHRMEPYVTRTTNSKGPAQYAIELAADQARTTGVHEGDRLRIPDAVKSAPTDP